MKHISYFAKLPVDAGKYSCYNNNMDKMKYNFTCRLFTDTKCFGPGVAQLLHTVDRLHSLRAAAAEMEMAYSKAWNIIRNSEAALALSSSTPLPAVRAAAARSSRKMQ